MPHVCVWQSVTHASVGHSCMHALQAPPRLPATSLLTGTCPPPCRLVWLAGSTTTSRCARRLTSSGPARTRSWTSCWPWLTAPKPARAPAAGSSSGNDTAVATGFAVLCLLFPWLLCHWLLFLWGSDEAPLVPAWRPVRPTSAGLVGVGGGGGVCCLVVSGRGAPVRPCVARPCCDMHVGDTHHIQDCLVLWGMRLD